MVHVGEHAQVPARACIYEYWGRRLGVMRHLRDASTSTKVVIGALWLLMVAAWANYLFQ